jgi:hypothetical protein
VPAPNTARSFIERVAIPMVVNDECWPWTGQTVTGGYGRLGWQGRREIAHRVAWELFEGPIPEGQWVLHHCDNPPCCNPLHLYAGTQRQNIHDAIARGRFSPPPRRNAA